MEDFFLNGVYYLILVFCCGLGNTKAKWSKIYMQKPKQILENLKHIFPIKNINKN